MLWTAAVTHSAKLKELAEKDPDEFKDERECFKEVKCFSERRKGVYFIAYLLEGTASSFVDETDHYAGNLYPRDRYCYD